MNGKYSIIKIHNIHKYIHSNNTTNSSAAQLKPKLIKLQCSTMLLTKIKDRIPIYILIGSHQLTSHQLLNNHLTSSTALSHSFPPSLILTIFILSNSFPQSLVAPSCIPPTFTPLPSGITIPYAQHHTSYQHPPHISCLHPSSESYYPPLLPLTQHVRPTFPRSIIIHVPVPHPTNFDQIRHLYSLNPPIPPPNLHP